MKIFFGKIQTIFDIENWLWKSEIGTFQISISWFRMYVDLPKNFWGENVLLMTQLFKLPLYVEVAEKFLNGI